MIYKANWNRKPKWKSRLTFLLAIVAIVAGCGGGSTTPAPESACGTVPYPSNTGSKTPNPIIDSPEVWTFASAPNLHPMKVTVNTNEPEASSELIFVDPFTPSTAAVYGQPGALILDNNGNPVWFRSLSSPNLMINNFQVQQFNGQPVLTYWQGTIATPPVYTNIPAGGSEPGGCYYIMDNNYHVLRTLTAHNGFTANSHDFVITPSNTALFIASKVVPMDLTPYGGPQDGAVYDLAVQEVDLQTDQLIFLWDALDHIPLSDSYENVSDAAQSTNVWDAYHLNSVGLTDDPNDILVSGRSTSTIYRINKPTGSIVWQLGGKQSDFTIQSGAEFSWQHDARWLPNNVVSLFDDNCCETPMVPPDTPPSHGLLLQLDLSNMIASVATEYYHDPNVNTSSQGNTQILDNGDVFVGWGDQPYYTEYSSAGNNVDEPGLNTLYDAQMPGTNNSYRVFREAWIGRPLNPPSVAAKTSGGQTLVYASWNGSTETDSWQIFGGSNPDQLSLLKTAMKSGFETVATVSNAGPFFQVKALNAGGQVIGISNIITSSR
ncbi:MAG: arylsulfotransferase family protein [Candidatus Binatus sp.]